MSVEGLNFYIISILKTNAMFRWLRNPHPRMFLSRFYGEENKYVSGQSVAKIYQM